jgi:hypothetical protein
MQDAGRASLIARADGGRGHVARLGLADPSPFGTHTIARINSVLDASVR